MFELDHLFVFVDVGAPEAALLGEFGLTNGSEHLLEVTFDAGTQGRAKDFRPVASVSVPMVNEQDSGLGLNPRS